MTDTPAPVLLDAYEPPPKPRYLTAAEAMRLAYEHAARNGGTLSSDAMPEALTGVELTASAGDVPSATDEEEALWLYLARYASMTGGAVIYTCADGRRLRFKMGYGNAWYASHFDRASKATVTAYARMHSADSVGAAGLARVALRMGEKVEAARLKRA